MTAFINKDDWGELYPDRATLEAQSQGTRNARGVPATGWVPVSGLVDLPCQKEMKGGDEIPGVDGATAVSTHTITFQHYHPAITEAHRCVIDGQIYNILLADSDPMKTTSILKAKKVTG